MKFYKQLNGLWVVGDMIIPAGTCMLVVRQNSEIVDISFINGPRIFNEKVTELKDSSDVAYVDLADFLDRCGDFFVNAAQVAADSIIEIYSMIGDIDAILDNINGEIV